MDLEYQSVEITHNNTKQHKTHFQCGSKYFDDGYAHIVAIAMSYSVLTYAFYVA